MRSPFSLSDTAAASLRYSKGRGGRTVAAAVPVAANEAVEEPKLTNVSFAIFIVFDMQKMQFMMEYTHIMAIPTAHSRLQLNWRHAEAEEGSHPHPRPWEKRRRCSNYRPCHSCENGWGVPQSRPRLTIAAYRLMPKISFYLSQNDWKRGKITLNIISLMSVQVSSR